MATTKIKGGRIMMFVHTGEGSEETINDYESLAFATNHSLSISADTVDTSNKDVSGDWATSESGTKSWTLSSENFYSVSAGTNAYEYLYNNMVSGTPIKLVYGNSDDVNLNTGTIDKQEIDANGKWHPIEAQGVIYKQGSALVTSLSLDANNGEYAKFSAELTGVGPLTNKQFS